MNRSEYEKAIAQFPMVCRWQRNSKGRHQVIWQADPPLKERQLLTDEDIMSFSPREVA